MNVQQITKYAVTGVSTFIVEYSAFVMLVYVLNSKPVLGQIISYGIALVVNFTLLRYWAFKSTNKEELHSQILKFAALVAVNWPLSTLLMLALTHLNVSAYIAKIVVIAFIALWNYIIYDKVIFKKKDIN